MQTPRRENPRRLAPISVVLAAALTLAACSQGTKGHPSTQPTGSTTPASSAAASSPSAGDSSAPASGPLTKPQFVAQMNAVCADTDKARNEVPVPSDPTQFAVIQEYFTRTLALYLSYIDQARALIARSPDSAELTEKWLKVEEADFEAARPYIQQVILAAAGKDAAKVRALLTKLSDLPDHSSELATYMTSYGLTACATLQSS